VSKDDQFDGRPRRWSLQPPRATGVPIEGDACSICSERLQEGDEFYLDDGQRPQHAVCVWGQEEKEQKLADRRPILRPLLMATGAIISIVLLLDAINHQPFSLFAGLQVGVALVIVAVLFRSRWKAEAKRRAARNVDL